jgi:Na+-transporting NADH:ubiquinone oxidoreductase subunit NqrB
MMFKKDNLIFGLILGFLAPLAGLVILRYARFHMLTLKEVWEILYTEPSHRVLTANLSVSLMMNAILFTFYVNGRRDKTAKGIFITTLVYGVVILLIKYLS